MRPCAVLVCLFFFFKQNTAYVLRISDWSSEVCSADLNPKMSPYIFGARGKSHIINLEETVPVFDDAMNIISGIAQKRGIILFDGTKRSARDAIKEEAERCGMPYMTQRWLGG